MLAYSPDGSSQQPHTYSDGLGRHRLALQNDLIHIRTYLRAEIKYRRFMAVSFCWWAGAGEAGFAPWAVPGKGGG